MTSVILKTAEIEDEEMTDKGSGESSIILEVKMSLTFLSMMKRLRAVMLLSVRCPRTTVHHFIFYIGNVMYCGSFADGKFIII